MRNFILGLIVGIILAGATAYAISTARIEEIMVSVYDETNQTINVRGL